MKILLLKLSCLILSFVFLFIFAQWDARKTIKRNMYQLSEVDKWDIMQMKRIDQEKRIEMLERESRLKNDNYCNWKANQ